jgi:hypothetical protein
MKNKDNIKNQINQQLGAGLDLFKWFACQI